MDKYLEVIIPNYNGFSLLEKNLPEVVLALHSYKNAKITIVDDCSEEDEYKKLNLYVSKLNQKKEIIHLRRNEANMGFASTVNVAAFASTAEFLIFLNSDVSPRKDFLKYALPHFDSDEKLFGVGFCDESIEGDMVVLRGRGIGYYSRGMLGHGKGEIGSKNTLWISGGSSVVRRSIFIKIGGFDTLYNPFYWEDIDLSYRAQKFGYTILFEEKSRVVHQHSKGAIKTHYSAKQVKIISYRNQFIFVWKNITDTSLVFLHIIWLPYQLLNAFIKGNSNMLSGFSLAAKRFPVIILKRFNNRNNKRRKDGQILSQFDKEYEFIKEK